VVNGESQRRTTKFMRVTHCS